nr:alcohol dehydrogenase catalytic domain-containing protein [Actinospica robiniae]
MRATVMYGAGDVRIEQVPDSTVKHPTDALVRVLSACICGSDLWPYTSRTAEDAPFRVGHEFLGIIEDIGREVATLKKGDLVVAPFAISDSTCEYCRDGLQSSCSHPEAGFWDSIEDEGGQAEAVRAPLADGTLVKLPIAADSALLPHLLTLTDVLGTGHHAAAIADVGPRTAVTVIGDGAVGLLSVLAAKRRGAERIILMGRHQARTDLGREFGATDVVAARGDEGINAVRELTGGQGTHVVIEAVGARPAVPDGYRAMVDRTSLKVHIKP